MSSSYFLHSDSPTLDDTLDRQGLVADMSRRAMLCDAPQVLGLHGDWGSGKTSVLLQLKAELEMSFSGAATVVWFEAWRHQNEAAPIVALLHAMRERLDWRAKAWVETKKITEVTVRSALLHWDELIRLIGLQAPKLDAAKIQSVGETWEKEHLAAKLPTNATTEILNQTLDSLLGKDAPKAAASPANRLIVIIDDLDRCHPEAAFKLLEGIKIYLGLRRCVFILGINQREVERAIEKHIPAANDGDSRSARAKEYLDKLCGHIWRLAYLSRAAQADLTGRLLKDGGVLEKMRNQVKQIVRKYGCVPPNPRKMKRFANAFIALWDRYNSKLASQPDHFVDMSPQGAALIITLIACLDAFHPEFHRRLQQHEGCYESLIRWCQGGDVKPSKDARPKDPMLEATQDLQLTHAISGTTEEALLYDPASPSVFYPQLLIARGCGDAILITEIQPFLRL